MRCIAFMRKSQMFGLPRLVTHLPTTWPFHSDSFLTASQLLLGVCLSPIQITQLAVRYRWPTLWPSWNMPQMHWCSSMRHMSNSQASLRCRYSTDIQIYLSAALFQRHLAWPGCAVVVLSQIRQILDGFGERSRHTALMLSP